MPLDLGHRPALGREDFLVAASNREAVAFLDLWPEWPARALFLHGPEACGKTHLAQVWRVRSGAVEIGRDDLSRDALSLLGGARHAVVEGLGPGINERGLLHLYNFATSEGGTLLLTAGLPPSRWEVGLPDLRSRLLALPAVAVGAPDDALIEAVMVKQFADRQVRVAPDVVTFLVPRLERSLATVRTVVAALDAAALAERRAITIPLAGQVLHRLGINESGPVSPGA
ncbi:MAG: DNA replication protein [Alphaproteobacteria bacterium]|nr:DNA replication protein [Alphaproteobacteria bacterium]